MALQSPELVLKKAEAFVETLELSYGARVQLQLLYGISISVWLYVVVRRLPAGLPRFAAVLPLVAANCCIPLLFHRERELITFVAGLFLYFWLNSFKIIGLALNRGSLCEPLNFLQFTMVALLPIQPQFQQYEEAKGSKGMVRVKSSGKLAESAGSSWELLQRLVAKVVALGIITYLLSAYDLPRIATEILYAFGLYSFLGFLMDGPATLVTSLMGLRISPHFDRPYQPASLAEFWGRRWNLAASNVLRFLVYDVIYEGRFVRDRKVAPRRSNARRMAGMLASFFVSGIIHEMIFFYTQHFATGLWLLYFTAQGPLLLAEAALARLIGPRIRPPWALSVLATLALLMAVADPTFFRPVMAYGDPPLADKVVEAIMNGYQAWLPRWS